MKSASVRTRIKFCGFTREQDVDSAVACGADAIGFVLYAPSPRAVSPHRAAQLARRDTAVAPEVPRHRLIADAGQPIC